MADLDGGLRSLSTKMDDLGALELETGVNLSEQSKKFDEIWKTFEKTPEKAFKAFADQLRTLTDAAQEKGTDQTQGFARDFGTAVNNLASAQRELVQAKAKNDPRALERAQDKLKEAQFRARSEYEIWKNGEVEQYKIAVDKQEQARKKADREIEDFISQLQNEVGSEGTEQFQTLLSGLRNVQTTLRRGGKLSNIKLPGGEAFDPKRNKFSRYLENWKRQNDIDASSIQKPSPEKNDIREKEEEAESQEAQLGKVLETTDTRRQARKAKIQGLKSEIKASRQTGTTRAAQNLNQVAAGAAGAAVIGAIGTSAARQTRTPASTPPETTTRQPLAETKEKPTPEEKKPAAEIREQVATKSQSKSYKSNSEDQNQLEKLIAQQGDYQRKYGNDKPNIEDLLYKKAHLNLDIRELKNRLEQRKEVSREIEEDQRKLKALINETEEKLTKTAPDSDDFPNLNVQLRRLKGGMTDELADAEKENRKRLDAVSKEISDKEEKLTEINADIEGAEREERIQKLRSSLEQRTKDEAEQEKSKANRQPTVVTSKQTQRTPASAPTVTTSSTTPTPEPVSTSTSTTATNEITFSGKIGRRLQKNVVEFEQIQQQIIKLQGKLEVQEVPDSAVIQELSVKIEQASQLRHSLLGDIQVQIEAVQSAPADQATAAIEALFASAASITAFTTSSATSAAQQMQAAGLPVSVRLNQAQTLDADEIGNLSQIASAAAEAQINGESVSTERQTRISNQSISNLNRLIGKAQVTPAGATAVRQFLGKHQATSKDSQADAGALQGVASSALSEALPGPVIPTATPILPTPDQPSEPSSETALPNATPVRGTGRGNIPTRGAMPKAPIGAGIGGLRGGLGSGGAAAAFALNSQKQQEQAGRKRDLEQLFSDTGLSDSSILSDEALEPVLTRYQQGMAGGLGITEPSASAEELAETGGGTFQGPQDELRRASQIQQQQQRSRMSFLGMSPQDLGALERATGLTPIRKNITENLSGVGQTAYAENLEDEAAAESTPSGGSDEQASARNLMRQQQAQQRQQMIRDTRKKIQEQTQRQIKQLAKRTAQKASTAAARVTVEGAQAVSGPEDGGVTWLTLIIEMNLQLILKYILKGFGSAASGLASPQEGSEQAMILNEVEDFANSIQSFWEDILTIWMDCFLVLAIWMSIFGPFIIIISAIVLPMLGVIASISKAISP